VSDACDGSLARIVVRIVDKERENVEEIAQRGRRRTKAVNG